jgi:hypothetical protein
MRREITRQPVNLRGVLLIGQGALGEAKEHCQFSAGFACKLAVFFGLFLAEPGVQNFIEKDTGHAERGSYAIAQKIEARGIHGPIFYATLF